MDGRHVPSLLVVGRWVAPPRAGDGKVVRERGDDGSVLLETAVAIPLLLAVAVALAWAISLTATTLALGDAARQVARDVARGVAVSAAIETAQATAPGASLQVTADGDFVVVLADKQVPAPTPILSGITVTLSQRVAIPREWT